MSQSYRSLPPLQTLRCFESAARLGSFTAAADELCVTQSAVSHQIRGLEETLGQQLFERVGNRMMLTSVGRSLAIETQRALDYLSQAYAVADPAERTGAEVLHFATQFAIVDHWLLPRMAQVRAATEGSGLRVTTLNDLSQLAPSNADVALVYGNGEMPDMIVEKVGDERIFPVCSPAFLARFPDLSPETMRRAPLLLHSGVTWNLWLEKAQLPISYPEQPIYFDDAAFTIRGAILGHGIAMARAALVQRYLADGTLVRPFALSVSGLFSYYLGWRSDAIRRRHLALRAQIFDGFRGGG
ncbi:LysR substrate-binding domain-containing protein [Sphingomonas hylomeconis]|uniref:LysR substrate-binding domain-containing protein n=1 Tax=Sphingomonas hylomeconis TaxID=1395958 RepID=A0ABV7SVA8_9SPHN|nr:LysR substrate-binding domain-containing protein [Sphingomonas hylomeconis]